jgi:hypothetical protein
VKQGEKRMLTWKLSYTNYKNDTEAQRYYYRSKWGLTLEMLIAALDVNRNKDGQGFKQRHYKVIDVIWIYSTSNVKQVSLKPYQKEGILYT